MAYGASGVLGDGSPPHPVRPQRGHIGQRFRRGIAGHIAQEIRGLQQGSEEGHEGDRRDRSLHNVVARMGAAGRERVPMFTAPAVVPRYEAAYERARATRSRARRGGA